MEILWLIIGFIIGLLVAWFYLDARHKKQSAEREAELLQNSRQADEALGREKDAHNATKQRISELEAKQASARGQSGSLTAEYKAGQDNLQQAKADGGETRELQERLRQRDADIKRLEKDLAECRAKAASAASAPATAASAGTPPAYAAASPASGGPESGAGDDLTRIKGIGQVLKGKLNRLGITTFKQIAEFTEADIERVNGELDFPGRIGRERWVEQAREFVRQ